MVKAQATDMKKRFTRSAVHLLAGGCSTAVPPRFAPETPRFMIISGDPAGGWRTMG